MIKDTQNKKIGACRAIMGLVFSLILIFGLFNGFSVKTAQAVNDYFDNVNFYTDNEGFNRVSIHIKTTFTENWGAIGWPVANSCVLLSHNGASGAPSMAMGNGDYIYDALINYNSIDTSICEDITYSAGNTYDLYFCESRYLGGVYFVMNENKINMKPYFQKLALTSANYIWFRNTINNYNQWFFGDTEYTYFTEQPTLTITYPQNNYEIAESFDIQGSYTLPAGSGYNLLMAGFFKAGNYDINWNNAVNVFTIPVSEPSGSFDNLRVSNYLPKDNYDIYFRVYGGGLAYEFPFYISNINIVSDLPYELPITGETPPDIPSFTTPSAQKIYEDYSDYDTPTPLFNIITGAIEPISQTIGDNLTFFSSRFKITNAKDAGEKAGNAVLIIRANAGVINSFFNDLPIAEILFLYLSALVVVIVFRIIRLLLKLIPFT